MDNLPNTFVTASPLLKQPDFVWFANLRSPISDIELLALTKMTIEIHTIDAFSVAGADVLNVLRDKLIEQILVKDVKVGSTLRVGYVYTQSFYNMVNHSRGETGGFVVIDYPGLLSLTLSDLAEYDPRWEEIKFDNIQDIKSIMWGLYYQIFHKLGKSLYFHRSGFTFDPNRETISDLFSRNLLVYEYPLDPLRSHEEGRWTDYCFPNLPEFTSTARDRSEASLLITNDKKTISSVCINSNKPIQETDSPKKIKLIEPSTIIPVTPFRITPPTTVTPPAPSGNVWKRRIPLKNMINRDLHLGGYISTFSDNQYDVEKGELEGDFPKTNYRFINRPSITDTTSIRRVKDGVEFDVSWSVKSEPDLRQSVKDFGQISNISSSERDVLFSVILRSAEGYPVEETSDNPISGNPLTRTIFVKDDPTSVEGSQRRSHVNFLDGTTGKAGDVWAYAATYLDDYPTEMPWLNTYMSSAFVAMTDMELLDWAVTNIYLATATHTTRQKRRFKRQRRMTPYRVSESRLVQTPNFAFRDAQITVVSPAVEISEINGLKDSLVAIGTLIRMDTFDTPGIQFYKLDINDVKDVAMRQPSSVGAINRIPIEIHNLFNEAPDFYEDSIFCRAICEFAYQSKTQIN